MCSSLKRENNDAKLGKRGESFTITTHDGVTCKAMWNGWARVETLSQQWLSRGWKSGDLHVVGYTEQGREYEVPRNYVLKIVVRDISGHGKIFNIVTREGKGKELNVHERFPILTKMRF